MLFSDSLFGSSVETEKPLAVRMRPENIDEIVGQDAIIGKGKWLRWRIDEDKLVSIILYGPPGIGKTTLAKVIAKQTGSRFVEVSAVTGTISDLRREIEKAITELQLGERTILFVDEIHRFNKSQQDALLHAVEDGTVTLIGATTENPYFEVQSALCSRCEIVELSRIDDADIVKLLCRALSSPKGYNDAVVADIDALEAIAVRSNGDARSALSTLEVAVGLAQAENDSSPHVTLDIVRSSRPRSVLHYDKADTHYDVVSAFIKSMRGSDPDAAIYWLARMIDAGEDPKFIARRIVIAASEDVGLADPGALEVAVNAFRAVEMIGYPECRIALAEAAAYMALAPKSNSAYLAIDVALDNIKVDGGKAVPQHLRDRHRPGAEKYSSYDYPHDYPHQHHWCKQQYLPDGMVHGEIFSPGSEGWEKKAVCVQQEKGISWS